MNPYAVKYGLGRAWGYTALTLGLWLVFWFHRTRKLLDGELGGGRDDSLLHSLGLDLLRRWHGLPEIPVVAYLAGGALAPAVMYSLALGKVNEFWDVRTQGLATDASITGAEKPLLSLGVAIWVTGSAWMVLIVLSFFERGPLVDVV